MGKNVCILYCTMFAIIVGIDTQCNRTHSIERRGQKVEHFIFFLYIVHITNMRKTNADTIPLYIINQHSRPSL